MAILTILLGVLMIVGGVCSFFTPLATFLAAGYIIGIMLFVFGIFALIRAIQKKAGALAYITAFLAIIVGFLAVFRPGGTLAIDFMVLTFIAIWFLLQGITSLVLSIRHRDRIPAWGFGVLSGILGIAAGIISLIYPHAEMFAVGILIGMFLIESGIALITFGGLLGNNE